MIPTGHAAGRPPGLEWRRCDAARNLTVPCQSLVLGRCDLCSKQLTSQPDRYPSSRSSKSPANADLPSCPVAAALVAQVRSGASSSGGVAGGLLSICLAARSQIFLPMLDGWMLDVLFLWVLFFLGGLRFTRSDLFLVVFALES